MLRAKHLFPDGQRSLKVWLHVGISPLGMVKRGEVVEARSNMGMLRAKHLLYDG